LVCNSDGKTQRWKNIRLEFVKRVLRIIFGPNREKAIGEWRKLYNEQLHDWYSLQYIFWLIKRRQMIWTGHMACIREKRNMCMVLVGKFERNKPPGRLQHGWEVYLETDCKGIQGEQT
jgi:hypothetical protein